MRKIVASMLMAMDGVVENPQWTVQFRSEESQKYKFDELFASDALLLGRITYQELAADWPGVTGTGAYGERINSMPSMFQPQLCRKLSGMPPLSWTMLERKLPD